MDQLITRLKHYLQETLDINVRPKRWQEAERLPFFLRDLYVFFEVTILGLPCLAMVAKEETEQTPATVRKHMLQVQKKWPQEIIYVQPKVTGYNRKRLIEHKLPFVVPNNQMYLPFLGIDLREHFKKIHNQDSLLSPATQVVVLHALFFEGAFCFTPKELAERLGYTPMTMTRALDELENTGLGQITVKGRERFLHLGRNKRELWEKAVRKLRNPVVKRFWLRPAPAETFGPKAGLLALAHYSRLAEPRNSVSALDRKRWKRIQPSNIIRILDIAEPDALELEIWCYPPDLFANEGVVDRFSLYLSLLATEDERVEAALEEMMEQVAW